MDNDIERGISERHYDFAITYVSKLVGKGILLNETSELMISIISRVRKVRTTESYTEKMLLLLGALSLAVKMNETCVMLMNDLCKISRFKLRKKELIESEVEILKILGFKILKDKLK